MKKKSVIKKKSANKNRFRNKIKYLYRDVLLKLNSRLIKIKLRNKTKIFCIGKNKTGTTSLTKAFRDMEFIIGNQSDAEGMIGDYIKKDFTRIIEYCKTAEFFQDVPFSMPETYKVLDKAYPNSKFILTVRDDASQWYNSITKFHAKLFGNGNIPTWDDLKNATYKYKGWMHEVMRATSNLTDSDEPYDKTKLTNLYEKYNQEVMCYFENRPNDLLIINLSDKDAYKKFCDFIGMEAKGNSFPWENKTDEI